jgi:dTDP-4-dehydrorhamnose reductase
MSAGGQTTWYDFAEAILEEAQTFSSDLPWFADATKGRPLITRRIIPISSEAFHSPAIRPPYSVLSNSRLAQTFGITLPHWRDQLKQCFVPSPVPANLRDD